MAVAGLILSSREVCFLKKDFKKQKDIFDVRMFSEKSLSAKLYDNF